MEPYIVVQVVFYLLLMVVGIPGNLLIILVTTSRKTKRSVHVLVIALAVADLLACCLLPFGIHYWLTFNKQQSSILCKAHIFTNFLAVFTTMFLTNAVAFDRYFAVCYPLKTFLNVRRSCVVCVVCFVSALVCSVPSVLAFGIRSYGPEVSQCTITANQWLIEGIYGIIVLTFLLSTAVLIILYLQMCIMLRRQVHFRARVGPAPVPNQEAQPKTDDIQTISDRVPIASSSTNTSGEVFKVSKSTSNMSAIPPRSDQSQLTVPVPPTPAWHRSSYEDQRKALRSVSSSGRDLENANVGAVADAIRDKTTKMLILSTAVFIASWLPNIIIKAVPSTQYEQLSQMHPALLLIIRSFEYLFLINHAVNPFVYSLVNKRFRGVCAQYIRALRKKFTKQ